MGGFFAGGAIGTRLVFAAGFAELAAVAEGAAVEGAGSAGSADWTAVGGASDAAGAALTAGSCVAVAEGDDDVAAGAAVELWLVPPEKAITVPTTTRTPTAAATAINTPRLTLLRAGKSESCRASSSSGLPLVIGSCASPDGIMPEDTSCDETIDMGSAVGSAATTAGGGTIGSGALIGGMTGSCTGTGAATGCTISGCAKDGACSGETDGTDPG